MREYRTLRVGIDDGIAVVTIDNPPINLFTIEAMLEMLGVVEALAVDEAVRVVVLQSDHPDFFIAHFDVEAILRFPTTPPSEPSTELNAFHRMCEALRTMPKATIAVVEGRAGGGGSELALSCDMRVAALPSPGRTGAIFNQVEVSLGILPGGSGTVRLARLVGRGRALEAILGCDDVDARTAELWGWVNRALPAQDARPFAHRLARRIASFPPHAVAAAKASVLRAERGVREDLLAEGDAFQGTLGGPGTQESLRAFLELGGQTPEGEARLGDLAAEAARHVATD